jgi:putative transposase
MFGRGLTLGREAKSVQHKASYVAFFWHGRDLVKRTDQAPAAPDDGHCQVKPSLADSSDQGKDGEMKKPPNPYHGHRCFPAQLINHTVRLYHIFSLSSRDVELLLAERGVIVSYESVRQWCLNFSTSFADTLRRRRRRPGDKWHLDEVFIRIEGVSTFCGAPLIKRARCSTS